MQLSVPGLQYYPNYLDQAAQQEILTRIDEQPWLNSLKRRVQQYGYRYDYSSRKSSTQSYLGPLPDWLLALAQGFEQQKLVSNVPDQVIINEYEPGQGISGHIDCTTCFDDTILSLSLLSSSIMCFTHAHSKEQVSVLLEPGSLLIMQNFARYSWKHEIPARKTDIYEGKAIKRQRRVSLTFRNMLMPVG